jgi:hypothetical protein
MWRHNPFSFALSVDNVIPSDNVERCLNDNRSSACLLKVSPVAEVELVFWSVSGAYLNRTDG